MLWKKKIKVKKPVSQKLTDQAASRIAGALLLIQRSWSNWMSKQEQRLSVKCKAIVFGFLSIIVAGFSLSLLFGSAKENDALKTNRVTISIPKMKSYDRHGIAPGFTDPIYKRIQRFRKYLDSLATSEAGRGKLDSLTVKRPGLMDSLAKVEKLYQQLNQ